MIIVLGYIHLNPADVDDFVTDVRAIIPGTRAQKGCLFYTATVDDARSGRMLIAERWQDQESLTAHLESSTSTAFLTKWTKRLTSDVLKYDASNERSLTD